MGFCIKLTHNMYQALSHAYILATFSNSELENIQDYFRNQLHLRLVFPDYDMEDYVVFISREEFLSYCEAKELQKSLDECIAARNKTGISAIGHKALEQLKKVKSVSESVSLANQQFLEDAPHLKMFTAVYVYSSVLSTCVEHLFTEKNGDPKLVKGWLDYLTREFPRSRKIGKWFYRLIQIHIKHLKPPNYEEAANILIDVLSNKTEELSDVDKHELGKLGKALKSTKAYKLERIYCDQLTEVIPSEIDLSNIYQRTFDAQCKRTNQLGKKRKYVAQHGDDNIVMAVEDYALACYRDEYPGGMHCEGSLLRSLLVLFFWDIIYKPKNHIPGVFITKIQTAPLDMFTKYFLKNRMAAIKKRLHEIQSVWSQEELVKFAQENYKSHAHEKSVFGLVNHVIENADMVDVLLKVIDRRLLACIFLRILSDLRQFRSGMPDLFLWNVNEGKCKFVEVKGEGDKLSTTQELWLQYLKEKGADVEICYIHSKGSKRRKLNRQRDCTKKEQKEKGNVIEAEVNNLASHC
ncbi:fanconi-associated nuclease 1-like isoform X2 [Cylas formicarius]|nr:fanconi-associated nuclease 1-like isoform X2 [Cylas formicarius]